MRAALNIPDASINGPIVETGEDKKTRLIKTALEEMLKSTRGSRYFACSGFLPFYKGEKGKV